MLKDFAYVNLNLLENSVKKNHVWMIAMEKEHAMTVPVFVIKDGEVQIVLKDMLYMEKSFQMEL